MKPLSHLICDRQPIALDAIVWLEGDWNYTRIYLQDQPVRLSSYTLKWYEDKLSGFWRVRKNALVNPIHIQELNTLPATTLCVHNRHGLQVVLSNGVQLEVTRRRRVFIRREWAQRNKFSGKHHSPG